MGALRTQKIFSATYNEKCVTVTQKKWRIFDTILHIILCDIHMTVFTVQTFGMLAIFPSYCKANNNEVPIAVVVCNIGNYMSK